MGDESGDKDKDTKTPYKRIQYMVLGRNGLEFKLGPNKKRDELMTDEVDERFANRTFSEEVKTFEYSPIDGSLVVVLTASGLVILNTDTGDIVNEIKRPGIQRVAFSPLGTFVLTWEKFQPNAPEGNMKVWRVSDGQVVFHANEKNLLSATWPMVKWTDDELVAAHMVKNNLHMYNGTEFGRYDKVKCESVAQFSIMKLPGPLSEENPCKVACFIPEVKSTPAKVSMYLYHGEPTDRAVGGRSFFKAQEAEFKWSPLGNAVLCKTETDIDSTGQSYYGETQLFLLHADGQFDCNILPAKEGSFQDFAWSPQGRQFVAISGKSPAKSILYNLKGDAVFDFGAAHRNTIRWSPHGRFLCLGGFGNLSGDMDFWDINKKAKMGSTRANCAVTQEFSPCGRFFMTATLFPRMRVDNGVTFYNYRGELLYTVNVVEASRALWRPAAPGIYADRPQSPLKNRKNGNEAVKAVAPPAPPKKQVYRPPGATGALSAMIRKEREGTSQAKALTPAGSSGAPTVVGGGPSNNKQGKSKAALRRERKKRAQAAATE